ncbi:MAG: hypothetical protein R3C59_11600 [Planctomycetaceae bacterium]
MTGQSEQRGVLKPALNLTLAIAMGWVVCFWPARLLNGSVGVWWMTIAAICCLIPGWIVVFLSSLAIFPNDLAAMLVQMTVRLAIVGGAAVVVKKLRPEFGPGDFTGWLIGFYLLALFFEVYLLRSETSKHTASDRPDEND